MRRRQNFLLLVGLAAATSALAQDAAAQAGAASSATRSATWIPDFSGIWAHPTIPGFEPPASGPGPVVNKSRNREGPQTGRSANQFVGDYTNPILKPQAAEAVKRHGEIEQGGGVVPNPHNQCWPEPLPYIFWNMGMQMLQQPDRITIIYYDDNQVRRVRMNEPHPAKVTPSWYGDSVGHYEEATLVIDTVGVKTGRPFAVVDMFGTPYTEALHVVERYRLLDYEAAKEGLERDAKENFRAGMGPWRIDPNFRGKHLQLQFTVEDEGVFTTPWSATITYGPGFNGRGHAEWPELVCAESLRATWVTKDSAVPRADKPDF
jgi:hypothetical protein